MNRPVKSTKSWTGVCERRRDGQRASAQEDSPDARNARNPQYAAPNTTKGTVAPRRMGTGGSPGGRTKTPSAPRKKTSASQMASTTWTSNFTLERRPVGSEALIVHFLRSIVTVPDIYLCTSYAFDPKIIDVGSLLNSLVEKTAEGSLFSVSKSVEKNPSFNQTRTPERMVRMSKPRKSTAYLQFPRHSDFCFTAGADDAPRVPARPAVHPAHSE